MRGWVTAAHAFPLAAVMALTALVAFASSGGEPDPGGLALLLVAMLGCQLAIGWSNDYLDREADAVYQPWKPIARGEVDARKVPLAIGIALAVGAAAGLALGLAPFALVVVGTSAGLVYNMWLKASRFSFLPFVIGLGVLPVFVWTALDVYQGDFLALYFVATPLAVAAHLANVLPDVESDRGQGRRTLAVALRERASVAVVGVCLVAPLPLTYMVAALSGKAGDFYDGAVLMAAVAVYVAVALAAAGLYVGSLWRASRAALVWAFRCVAVASVVFVGGWLAAVA